MSPRHHHTTVNICTVWGKAEFAHSLFPALSRFQCSFPSSSIVDLSPVLYSSAIFFPPLGKDPLAHEKRTDGHFSPSFQHRNKCIIAPRLCPELAPSSGLDSKFTLKREMGCSKSSNLSSMRDYWERYPARVGVRHAWFNPRFEILSRTLRGIYYLYLYIYCIICYTLFFLVGRHYPKRQERKKRAFN